MTVVFTYSEYLLKNLAGNLCRSPLSILPEEVSVQWKTSFIASSGLREKGIPLKELTIIRLQINTIFSSHCRNDVQDVIAIDQHCNFQRFL